MNKKYAPLLEPAYIGKLKIKNKMARAPMGPIGYADPHYAYNQRLQDYYVERVERWYWVNHYRSNHSKC
mgnify:CR=1 FL=1